MDQGEKDSSLMLLWLLPKVPTGPEFSLHLTFDKCSAKQITVVFNLLTMLTNLNTTAALKLLKLRRCKN